MDTVGAKLVFDTSKAIPEVDKYIKKLQQAEAETGQFGEFVDSIGKKVMLSLGAVSLGGLVKEIVNVRGEFQQTEVALTTMLGSQKEAMALNSQLLQTAAKTPFDYKGIVQEAKNLLAYGFAADQVNETIIRLGDVASGLSQPLGDIAYLYGTLRASGRVTNIDIRQFANRGIPVYEELAKVLGVSADKINGMVSAGKVGFPHIEQMFKNMTSEGGKFANLMEKQSKTITGQISNLQDNIEMMFNEIGKSSEGIISKSISAAGLLVENYETVGKVLISLAATYGVYRTAVMLTAATTNGWTIATKAQYTWLLLVEKAQKALNATMLKNPYVLIASLVAGLVASMWALNGVINKTYDAQKEFNDLQEEAAKKEEERRNKVSRLIEVSRNESISTQERQKALQELSAYYPNIFSQYDTETIKLADIAKLKREIAALDGKMAEEDFSNRSKAAMGKVAELKKAIDSLKKQINSDTDPTTGKSKSGNDARLANLRGTLRSLQKEYGNAIALAKEFDKETKKKDDTKRISRENLRLLSDEDIKKEIATIDKLFEKRRARILQGKLKENDTWTGRITDGKILRGEYDEKQLQGFKAQLENFLSDKNKTWLTYSEQQKKVVKELRESEKELSDFNKKNADELKKFFGETGKDPDAYRKELEEKVKAKKKEADSLGVGEKANKAADSAAKKASEEAKKLAEAEAAAKINNARLIADARHEADQIEIDVMKEGIDKKLRQEVLNYEKRMEAINRSREDAQKQAKDNGIAFDGSAYEEQEKNALNTFNTNSAEILKSEQKLKDERLKEFQDYATKRIALEEEFNKKIAQLKADRELSSNKEVYDGAIKEAEKKKTESLANLSFEEFQGTELWRKAFGDLDKLSADTLNGLRDKLKAVDVKGWTAENVSALENAIENIDKALVNRSPIQSAITLWNEYWAAVKDGNKDQAQEKLKGLADLAANEANKLSGIASGIGELFGEDSDIGHAAQTVSDLAGAFSDAAGAAASFASGDILGGIQKTVSAITKVFSIGKRVKEMNEKARKEVEEFYERAEQGEREYQALLRKRQREEEEFNARSFAVLAKRQRMLKEQQAQIKKNYEMLMALLQSQNYVASERYRHGTWFRKAKVIKEYGSMAGMSYDEIEHLYIQGKLEEKAKALFEQLKKLKEEGLDVESMLKDETQSFAEALSGITFEGLQDSLKEMLSDGKISITETANFMKQKFKEAILNTAVMKQFDGQIKALFETMVSDVNSGSYLDKFDYYSEQMNAIADQMNEYIKPFTSLFSSIEEMAGSAKGFQTMSQDTGNELSGRFTAMVEMQAKISEAQIQNTASVLGVKGVLEEYLPKMDNSKLIAETAAMNMRVEEIRNVVLNLHLPIRKIQEYTSVLPVMDQTLKRIEKKLQ